MGWAGRPGWPPLRYAAAVRLQADPEVRRAFRDVPSAHMATLLPDGSPHVVPLWFVWLDEAVYVTCRAGSQVARNLERDPRATVEIDRGRAWSEHRGVVLWGRAERLAVDSSGAKRAMSAWFEKYRADLGGASFAAYAEQVTQPLLFRIVPDRVAGWPDGPRPGT